MGKNKGNSNTKSTTDRRGPAKIKKLKKEALKNLKGGAENRVGPGAEN